MTLAPEEEKEQRQLRRERACLILLFGAERSPMPGGKAFSAIDELGAPVIYRRCLVIASLNMRQYRRLMPKESISA